MAKIMHEHGVMPVGLRASASFGTEALRALRGLTFARSGSLSREAVQEYFMQRSRAGDIDMSDVVASGSRPYRRIIRSTLDEVAHLIGRGFSDVSILDFGCGNGAMLSILRKAGFRGHYIGYDFNELMMKELSKLNSPCQHFQSRFPSEAYDVVLLINVLAYTNDSELFELLSEATSNLNNEGCIIVADPAPAWYWETRFDRLQLRLRSLVEVDPALSGLGLVLHQAFMASVGVLGRHPIFPLAWSGIWRNIHAE